MGNTAKIVIAILVLLAIALGVSAYMVSQPSPVLLVKTGTAVPQPPVAGVAVVVAAQTLSAGVPIAQNGIKILHYPEFPAGAFHQADHVVGKVPQVNIGMGAPVMASNLLSGLATQVPSGDVAMAVDVNKAIAVGDHLRPGDFVDVFSTLAGDQMTMHGGWPTQSRLLLADLRVLAVGPQTVVRHVAESRPSAFGPATDNSNQPPREPPSTVVLEVPVASAATLALASGQGHLLLALRNPKDHAQPDTQAFPTPPPALIPTRLPVTQRQKALAKPENRAYAGLTLPGLAGKGKAAERAMHPLPPPPMMEIYQGGQKTAVPY
ncbi:MAG: Flp pilus assembly protein CpaB [Acidithiobacillus ferrivorans]